MTESIKTAHDCWFLTGATASGKSRVSIELAKLIDAEIISMDSMAIYRGMDIGTAKTPISERNEVPHHMIDVRNPDETFSTSQYRTACFEAIDSIRGRGKEVLFVGGTALYLKAMLRGMFEGPPADWDFRKEVEAEIADSGGEMLHERLQMIDPVAAHNIHPNDHRRLIRALEVFKVTGKPISHWQMEFDQGRPAEECKVFALRHTREILHDRIGARVEWMFEQGLVEEVKTLLKAYDELSHTAAQAVGYREVIEFLNGVRDESETHEKVLIRTRKFARHQETWFRNLKECQWFNLQPDFDPTSTAKEIFEIGKQVANSQ